MEFKFDEKESFSLEEVKKLVSQFSKQADKAILEKDEELKKVNLTLSENEKKLKEVDKLSKTNHQLNVKNLMLRNNVAEDLFDLVNDEDIKKVEEKITKIKELQKQEKVDNSYRPKDKKKPDDGYDKAIKDNNVEQAIKFKLGNLFKQD